VSGLARQQSLRKGSSVMPKLKLGKLVKRTAASLIKKNSADDKHRNEMKTLTIKPQYKNKRLEKK
jgi:hypothetical protein